jgi:hypothetical protein
MKKTDIQILYRCARLGLDLGIRVWRDASGYESRKVDTIYISSAISSTGMKRGTHLELWDPDACGVRQGDEERV